MEAPPLERKLVAILAADIQGYSRLMSIAEEDTLATLSAHRAITDAIIAQHGGRILARGGRYKINEGPHDFHRFVVIEFPTLEQGVACFESPEYQHAAAFRRAGGGIVENVMVDGGDATQ